MPKPKSEGSLKDIESLQHDLAIASLDRALCTFQHLRDLLPSATPAACASVAAAVGQMNLRLPGLLRDVERFGLVPADDQPDSTRPS